jgi:hypothetical protein
MRPVSRWLALATAVVLVTGCGGSDDEPRASSGSGTTSAGTTSTAAPQSLLAGAKGWLAYQSISSSGPDGVYLVQADGSDDHEIVTDIPGQRSHPDFSRDGEQLAFDQRTSDDEVDQVYVADADGSGARQVSKCRAPKCAGLWEPAWSPDGSQLAIASSAGFHPGAPSDRFGIAIIDVAREPCGLWSTMTSRPAKTTSPVGRLMDAGSCSGVIVRTRGIWRSSWSMSRGRVFGGSPNGICERVTRTGRLTESSLCSARNR